MSAYRIGFIIPEFPQQTHIAWWRVSEGMRLAGAEVHFLSTRRPDNPCPHPQLIEAAKATAYLWPPSPKDVLAAKALLRNVPAVAQYLASLTAVHGKERLKTLAFVPSALRLLRLSRERKLDHIFVHSCANAAHVLALCRILGGPSYSLRLGGDLEVYGGDHRQKMERATLIVPAAKSYEARLVNEVGAHPDRVMWSWVGTDTDLFKPAGSIRKDTNLLRLITIARLNPAKGYQFAIPALAKLGRLGFRFRYRIVGAGPFEPEIRACIAEHGVGDSVEVMGSQSAERIAELHAESDVFILPTSGIGEGTPAAVCEAMSAGLAIVATAVGGIADMITPDVHGLIVPPGNSDALTDALARLAKDPRLLASMSLASREKALREFDRRAVAKRILDKIAHLETTRPA